MQTTLRQGAIESVAPEQVRAGANQAVSGTSWARYADLYLRLAIGVGFISAVADRFGIWGPPGARLVSWGNFHNFVVYTGRLNPWFPPAWIPAVGYATTACELVFGLLLVVGYRTRVAAFLSGALTLIFGLAMTITLGIKAPLNYSVFTFSAGALLLATRSNFILSLDNWMMPNAED